MSEHTLQQLRIEGVKDVRQQYAAAKAKHFGNGTEANPQRRSPRRIHPQHDSIDRLVQKVHGHKGPTSPTSRCCRKAYNPCRKRGKHLRRGFLAYHQVPEQPCCLCRTQRGDEKAYKGHTCQQRQFRTAVEGCYQRRCKEEQHVEPCTHTYRKPEDGIEVFGPHITPDAQGGGKTALLDIPRNHREHRQQSHQTIIFYIEHARKGNTGEHGHHLLGTVAKGRPEHTACGTFLQRH